VTPQDADARRMLVIGFVLLAFAVAGLLTFVAGWRPSAGPWRGDLLETSVSPGGRWEAQSYELNPGAMAHEHMRVQVNDLRDPNAEARTIYLEDGLGELSWRDADTIVVMSYATSERRELDVASAGEVTVGPDPESRGAVIDFFWPIVVGPLVLAFGLLGVLLLVAGSNAAVGRALAGSRGDRAAPIA
jgi:hypothetical protein